MLCRAAQSILDTSLARLLPDYCLKSVTEVTMNKLGNWLITLNTSKKTTITAGKSHNQIQPSLAVSSILPLEYKQLYITQVTKIINVFARDDSFTDGPDLSCSWAVILGGEYNTSALSSSGSCSGCSKPVRRTPNARLPRVGPVTETHETAYMSLTAN